MKSILGFIVSGIFGLIALWQYIGLIFIRGYGEYHAGPGNDAEYILILMGAPWTFLIESESKAVWFFCALFNAVIIYFIILGLTI